MADKIESVPSPLDEYPDDVSPRRAGKLDGRQMVVVNGRRYKPDTVAAATKARTPRADSVEAQPGISPAPAVPSPSAGGVSSIESIRALEYDDLKGRVEALGLATENKRKATLQDALAAHLGVA